MCRERETSDHSTLNGVSSSNLTPEDPEIYSEKEVEKLSKPGMVVWQAHLLDEHIIKENQPVGERACPQGSGSPMRAQPGVKTENSVHRLMFYLATDKKSYGERCRSTSTCQSPQRAMHAEELPSPPHSVVSKHPEFLSLNRLQC